VKREEIEAKIIEIIASYANMPQDKVELTHSLQDDLSIDSLGIIEILQEVEDVYKLTIDPEELGVVKTVGDAIDRIEKELNRN